MPIEVKIEPFRFPNYLRMEQFSVADPRNLRDMFPVGYLTEEQAAAYWDELRPLWLEHVKNRQKTEREIERENSWRTGRSAGASRHE